MSNENSIPFPNLPEDENSDSSQNTLNCFLWLLFSFLSVIVIGYASAFLPSRVKLLGLFPAGLGLMAAGMNLFWSNMWSNQKTGWLPVTSVILGLLCFSFFTFQSYRNYRMIFERELESSPSVQMPEKETGKIESEEEQTDREARTAFREMVSEMKKESREKMSLISYLQFRISALGDWSALASVLFWMTELLIAGTVSLMFTKRFPAQTIPFSQSGE